MTGIEAVEVAELTADEIEGRLEAGETIEVRMKRSHGLRVIGGGALMAAAFAAQGWWFGRPSGIEPFFLVCALPFLALIPAGLRKFLRPPVAFELRRDGLEAFSRPWSRDRIQWSDMRDMSVKSGAVWIELDESAKIERSWLERWITLGPTFGRHRRFDGVVVPAESADVDEGELLTFLERRLRIEILRGPREQSPEGEPAP